MKSKIMAASNMIHVGGIAIIAPGLVDNVLTHIFQGKDIGTLVGPLDGKDAPRMPGKKRWIAFYHRAQGMIEVDDGAKHALTFMGKSLLPVGITKVLGPFRKGSVVDIRDRLGNCFAKGIAQMDHHEIDIIKGGSDKSDMEVIHRDNLVILVGATYAKN
jgi:glutamate 5-kinase